MTGKSHIIINISSAVVSANILLYAGLSYNGQSAENVKMMSNAVVQYLNDSSFFSQTAYWILAISFFLVGSVLPDIDSEKSMISRLLHFHLPIEHRTWTHTLVFPVLFGILSLWFKPLLFLSIAYLLHLLWDNLSKQGVCFFYPFEQYIGYGSGAKVKKGHKLKVYRTGQASEFVLLGVVATLTVTMCVYFALEGFYSTWGISTVVSAITSSPS